MHHFFEHTNYSFACFLLITNVSSTASDNDLVGNMLQVCLQVVADTSMGVWFLTASCMSAYMQDHNVKYPTKKNQAFRLFSHRTLGFGRSLAKNTKGKLY